MALRDQKENQPPPTQSMNVTTSVDTMTRLTNVIAGLESRVIQMEQ